MFVVHMSVIWVFIFFILLCVFVGFISILNVYSYVTEIK